MGSGLRVTKGDDVNEIEVWKQGFISVPNPAPREARGERLDAA